MKQQISKTNETTRKILDFLLYDQCLAYRNNTSGTPVWKNGIAVGMRPAGKKGVSDICGTMFGGKSLYLEIKTNKDRLSPEQEGFLKQASDLGAVALVVKDYEDFLNRWTERTKRVII